MFDSLSITHCSLFDDILVCGLPFVSLFGSLFITHSSLFDGILAYILAFLDISEILQTNIVDSKLQEGLPAQMNCRWRVLCWFVAFTIRFKKPHRRNEEDRLSESSIIEDSASSETYSVSSSEDKSMQFETLYVTAEVVRSVLYSTRDNVLCLHEVLRQVLPELHLTFCYFMQFCCT